VIKGKSVLITGRRKPSKIQLSTNAGIHFYPYTQNIRLVRADISEQRRKLIPYHSSSKRA